MVNGKWRRGEECILALGRDGEKRQKEWIPAKREAVAVGNDRRGSEWQTKRTTLHAKTMANPKDSPSGTGIHG